MKYELLIVKTVTTFYGNGAAASTAVVERSTREEAEAARAALLADAKEVNAGCPDPTIRVYRLYP